ncbi:MAG TPA: NAD(P)-dependent oxidoreductase [Candidatus Pygmaiobacter gallistercoris]|nr:NAD(P)-dependent oxidoreductase [Candidatus Pygmaiobacter gallistercoris]
MKKIGFIGIGVMGGPMALNLMRAGYELTVYSRTRAKCEAVLSAGARWADSPAACAEGQDAVLTMVGFPKDVEQVYFGQSGIFASVRPGMLLIDLTTTSPKLSKRIFEEAKKRGADALDAPVSGGDTGAKAGTLAIMAGGEEAAFERARPILEAMGKNVVYEGPAGSGQHTKMANQIAIAGAVSGVCEAIAYGRAEGLDLERMLATISTGAAGSWQMTGNGPKMISGDFAPGFYIKHFIKDMRIAGEEAQDAGLSLAMLDRVLAMYRELDAQGLGDLGTQALIRYYDKQN